jgi:nucleoside-diphosphate-sugar epimerase
MLKSLGATPAIVDALDADALKRAVVVARPTHVVHQLTALPKGGAKSARDLEPTNRLRIEGTRNLLAAAVAAGTRRIVGGSFAPIGGLDNPPAELEAAADAIRSMESQIFEANRTGAIEGVVLRYGLFYGPETASTLEMMAMAKHRMLPAIRNDRSLLACIHVDDAASATVAALDRAPAGSNFDIVDDVPVSFSEIARAVAEAAGAPRPIAVPSWLPRLVAPFMAKMISMRLVLSNQKGFTEMGWRPSYPSIHQGLARTRAHAA